MGTADAGEYGRSGGAVQGPDQDTDRTAGPGLDLPSVSGEGSDAVEPGEHAASPQRTLRLPSRMLQAAAAGYGESRPAERAALEMTTSFAVTIAASRLINYVRERSRTMPRTRGVGRLLVRIPASNDVRVHHFLPGVGIGFASGATAIFRRADGWEHWLSVPFGIGLALTTDELPLLAGRTNPYWGPARFALVQGVLATSAAAGLGGLLVFRGRSGAAGRRSGRG